jgi:hypothetical protein
MRQIELLVEVGIDFLEISGGTFEDPTVSTPYLIYIIYRLTLTIQL